MGRGSRWSESETIQVGKDIVGLARELAGRLEDRNITSAFLDACESSIARAEAAASGQSTLLGAQIGTTVALDQLLERANRRVVAVRTAIKRVHPKRKDLHKAFDVGGANASLSMKDALGAIDAVVTSAASYPAEAAAAHVLARDLDELRSLRDAIRASDRTQEGAKGAKKAGTAARDDLLREIVTRVDEILAAANLEFVEEPAILERFHKPIPSKKKKKKDEEPREDV